MLNLQEDVYFEPQVDSTSAFGVEIDTVNQQNEAIEGSGTLTLVNDQDFWPKNFDKLAFENQECSIYSYSRELDPSEAKLLFRGKVESKTYSSSKIQFKLKDLMADLKSTIALSTIGSLSLRSPANLSQAYQRMIFGRAQGFRPVNIDALQNGSYPITGTVTVSNGSATVTGSSTLFLKELSPDDVIVLSGVSYTIATVDSNTSLTLTETYATVGESGLNVEVKPANSKRWMNRVWKIAGHSLNEPLRTTLVGSSTSRLFVSSTEDIRDGDRIYVGTLGSGELVTVDRVVNSTQLVLSESLSSNPVVGTAVRRPAVQKIRINDNELLYYRDFTLDASSAVLTLRESAEINAGQTRESTQQGTFTNGSRTVTGTGTFFKTLLKPGAVIRPKGSVDFYEVLAVVSDTEITLRTAPSGLSPNPKTAQIQFKDLVLWDNDVLSLEVSGRTVDGTTNGKLLSTAPEIVKTLLVDLGAENELDVDSFINASNFSGEELSVSIPKKFDEKKLPTYRDIINEINKSVFGVLLQNQDFKFSYDILRPQAGDSASLSLKEHDCLGFKVTSTNKNVIQKALVEYNRKEFDYEIKQESIQLSEKTSDYATIILKVGKQKTFQSLLVNQADADRLAARWSFLLENSTNQIEIETKLQAMELQINDVIMLSHQKLYERFSGTAKAKILLIERIEKSASGVTLAAVDLSNAFNRVCFISNTTTSYTETEDVEKLSSGFYCDSDGTISADDSSFGTNLIW